MSSLLGLCVMGMRMMRGFCLGACLQVYAEVVLPEFVGFVWSKS